MEIFVFDFDTGNETVGKILKSIHEEGIPHQYLECLCNYQDYIDHAPEVSIIHPSHDSPECHGKIREAIEKNPGSRFYIVASLSENRAKAIGSHPNARYLIGSENAYRELRDVLMECV
jgi:hypothetical protein